MLDQLLSSRAWLSHLALALLWETWMAAHCSGSGGLLLFAQPLVQQGPRSPLTVLGCPGNASLLPLLFKSILCPCVYHPWSKSIFSYKACELAYSLLTDELSKLHDGT